MGGGSWTSTDWDSFKSKATVDPTTGAAKTRDEIFDRNDMKPEFDPKNIKMRESRDSADHPSSTPVALALDVTGSMGKIPHELVSNGLNTTVTEILNRKPVSDPQIMIMAIGDAKTDRCPLQVSQYESDIRIAEQLKDLYLEGGGGGNKGESYNLAWYFLARKADIDSFIKRGVKGVLFTVGDENIHPSLKASEIERVFGDTVGEDIPTRELLRMVEERFDVYHLMIKEGGMDNTHDRGERWKELLGERVIPVTDYTKLPEIIVSVLEVIAGKPKHDVAASWSGSTAVVVREAVRDLAPTRTGGLVKSGTGAVWRPGGVG